MLLKLGQLQIKINWLVLLCLLSSLGMFISLGFWQLDRAAEKRGVANALERRAQATALPLAQAENSPDFGDTSPVRLEGFYENEIPFLISFQFWRGQAGFELITPFRSRDGNLVLLSRGWIAPAQDGEFPEIPAVPGEQVVVARVHAPDIDVPAAEVTSRSWPVLLSRLNVEQAGRLLGENVYPYVLRLDADQPGVQARHWQPPSISTRTHIAYAVQWFGIAAVVMIASFLYSSNFLNLWRQRRRAETEH
ncbi:SURF1 family protein [Pseudohongiella spirulinae]|uniref:SURF1-like protein n=1 Tax=Pseudohongiella spirulinae TaxID=1249552 RepID=A0A0S2KA64_9GAMM|nr:SURF1 family protein [Pseudohongiella spirulinae]ALO45264.1 hypothetical protein PS2015_581 [Pseudohongiella spirulinae]